MDIKKTFPVYSGIGFLLLGFILFGCSSQGSSPRPVSPTIFSVAPADLLINVSPSSNVEVTFSESMDASSAQSALSISTGGIPVSGTFSWSGYTMTFTPSAPLANSAIYTLSVSTAAANSAGTHLANAYNSTFTTGAPAVVSSITNIIDELETSDLSNWVEDSAGPGHCSRTDTHITSSGGWCYYSRSDIDTSNRKAFQIEAVLSADALPGDGESGARMWAIFYMTGTSGPTYYIELRLQMDGGVLNLHLDDFHGGGPELTLNKEWTSRLYRVRIKRQLVNGVDYIFLQAEDSNSWDDPIDPNNLNNANSVGAPLNLYQAAIGYRVGFGFGNFIVGDYSSEWESVHITVSEDANTILPYWPPSPPTPILYFDDKGSGSSQTVKLSAYCSSKGYLSNDTVTAYLNANGTLITGDTRTGPGDEYWDFDNINPGQDVTGYIVVSDVSGRSRTSSLGSISIPAR